MAQYEEEDFKPEVRLHEADVQKLLVSKEEVPPEQQEWSPSLDQKDLEIPHIKEEQEELWTKQEGEQLQELKEADIIKFTFTADSVKSEDDDEEKPPPEFSQLHQRQTEQMKTEADEEDCGGPEPASNSFIHSVNLHNQRTKQKHFRCSLCSKIFKQRGHLQSHMRTHTGEKPFSCSMCSKRYRETGNLQKHMRTHTGVKPFSCSVCSKSFNQRDSLQNHMRTHTGEKPFSCSLCSRRFSQRSTLHTHMRTHTGKKPFSCSVCSKSFKQRHNLRNHMKTHTGENLSSCSVCSKSFTRKNSLQKHMRVHTREQREMHQKTPRRLLPRSFSAVSSHGFPLIMVTPATVVLSVTP